MSSLNSNPPSADLHVSTNGTDWLWAAFCLIAFCLIIVVIITINRPRGARLFHEMAVVVLAISTITYFSLASGLGNAPAPVEFRGNGGAPTRQISYVRYIQWAINLPLLLLTLLLATGLPLSNIVITVFMGVIFVVMGLVGSLVHSTYKWGYFVFGVAALFFIWYVLLWHAPSMTFAAGGIVRRGYYVGAGFFSFILLTYPICWACSEGANVITVTSEMIWYGILDIFGGPIFLFVLLFELRNVDYNAFGLQSGKYVGNEEPIHVHRPQFGGSEKQRPQQGTSGQPHETTTTHTVTTSTEQPAQAQYAAPAQYTTPEQQV